MRFFTTPPIQVDYPYILINAANPDLRYIRKWRQGITEIIIDSGIEIFRDPNIKDYPAGHLGRLVSLYDRVQSLVQVPVWLTIPDYCDDYHPHSLWIDSERTNIERTHDNIVNTLARFPNRNWLIPIQGHNEEIESLSKSVRLLEHDGVLDSHDYFAVANLCTAKRPRFVRECLKFAKMLLPTKRLHAFGIDVRATRIQDFADVLYSFDSLAWTRPRGRGRASCRNNEERVQYFKDFLATLQ